jgi:FKBP-type peptidyl-prolyl cis-trans isomerase FkpA
MFRFLFLLCLSFTVIGGNAQYLTGPNGVQYFFWKSDGGRDRAAIGDMVLMDMVGKTDRDSVVISSYVQGGPFQIFVPKPYYRGCFFELFTMMGERDSAEVQVVADSFFLQSMGSPLPYFITPGSKLRITLKLNTIITKAEYDKRMADEAKHAPEIQEGEIQRYISENNLQMTKTESGLYYQFPLKGAARRVVAGDTVIIHYSGYFLDGRMFDSSVDRNQPYVFVVGTGSVIPGMDEAVRLMNVKDRLLAIVPYQLAYGEKGGSTIPPVTPLIFEIELLDIR